MKNQRENNLVGELTLPVPVLMIEGLPAFNIQLESILIGLGYPAALITSTANLVEATQFSQQHLPNLLVIDLNTDTVSSFEFISQFKRHYPDAHVIAVCSQKQLPILFQAIQAGAQGYIFYENTETEIVNNIKSILRGGAPIHHDIAQYILSHTPELNKSLSPQSHLSRPFTQIENEILNLVCDGLNAQQVAEHTAIPLYKIEMNIKNTYKKIACLSH
ncbi:response regulator transcription factor [Acinetobacter bouvetii]|uniref:Transcriptional regulatory protein DegU n=1 Tax=Acinetobacter bouvetii TaxID=202951 RepID=A0A811GJ75_9GAMM|nr:response regulator transcription factor [Acinetobacter bouvetii]CAB1215769.1 Transcriptional regulatory protein DegU [Acinetobacter bouvetii]